MDLKPIVYAFLAIIARIKGKLVHYEPIKNFVINLKQCLNKASLKIILMSYMKKLKSLIMFQLFILSILSSFCMKTQARQPCPAIKGKISFSVKIIPKNISYHLGISLKKLHQIAEKKIGQQSNQQVLGLTSTRQSISAKMIGQTNQVFSDLFCTRVISVDIKIRVIKLDVYVLGKYPRDSCQYAAIIDHEHEHVTTYYTGLNSLERVFNNKLWYMIRNLSPGIASTSKKASEAAFKNMRDKIGKVQSPIEQAMKYRNRQIDTPLSYKILTQQCATW